MKRDKNIVLAAILFGLLLSGCVKDKLFNTPNPDMSALIVNTDWSNVSSDAILPDSYTLRVDDTEQTVKGHSNLFNTLLTPVKHTLLVYNTPEGISVNGTTATPMALYISLPASYSHNTPSSKPR